MKEDPKYTPASSSLSRWKPLRRVGLDARWLWISLYTSREAKAAVPGLFAGSVAVVGDACGGVSPTDACNLLDKLIRAELAQWDQENELIRLLELPDHLARAHTEQAIHGWWGRFRNLPRCALRDSHVPALWDLVSAGTVNDKMRDAWRKTFGTITIPDRLPNFILPSSSDTGTAVQPSLFGDVARSASSNPINKISHSGPSGIHASMDAPRTGSGSGEGSGSGSGNGEGGQSTSGEIATGNDLLDRALSAEEEARARVARDKQNTLREVLAASGMTHLIAAQPEHESVADDPDPETVH